MLKRYTLDGGLSFAAGSDEATIPSWTGLDDLKRVSVVAWVRWDRITEDANICARWSGALGKMWAFGGRHSKLTAYITDAAWMGTSEFLVERIATYGIGYGVWFHVAYVFDGTQSTNATRMKIYYNGTLSTGTATGTIPASLTASTMNIAIGGSNNVDVSHLGIYPGVALTAAQVALDAAFQRQTDGLAVWLPMDEGTGTTAYDISGGDRDATLVSDTTWCAAAADAESEVHRRIMCLGGGDVYGTGGTAAYGGWRKELVRRLKAREDRFRVSLVGDYSTGAFIENRHSGVASNTIAQTSSRMTVTSSGGTPANWTLTDMYEATDVILSVGHEDMTTYAASTTVTAYNAVVTAILTAGAERVFCVNLPPSSNATIDANARLFNGELWDVIAARRATSVAAGTTPTVELIDIHANFPSAGKYDTKYQNDTGYTHTAKRIADDVEAAWALL